MDDAGLTDRVRFGSFELDVLSGELYEGPTRLKVPDQSLEILKALVERPGQLVTREELRQRLWPGNTFVDFEHGLNAAVRRLRDALGDSADTPKFIETLPRRGYRFVGPIEPAVGGAIHPSPEQRAILGGPAKPPQGRRAAIVALLFVAAGFALWWVGIRDSNGHNTERGIRSVAILPLRNVAKDPEQDYFVEGMHEALVTELARAGSLAVLGRGSTLRYATTDKTPETIARELNVHALVEGSVLRVGDKVRISVRLVDGTNGHTIWADSFDRDLRDVLALHAEVAQAIAARLISVSHPLAAPHWRSSASIRQPMTPISGDGIT